MAISVIVRPAEAADNHQIVLRGCLLGNFPLNRRLRLILQHLTVVPRQHSHLLLLLRIRLVVVAILNGGLPASLLESRCLVVRCRLVGNHAKTLLAPLQMLVLLLTLLKVLGCLLMLRDQKLSAHLVVVRLLLAHQALDQSAVLAALNRHHRRSVFQKRLFVTHSVPSRVNGVGGGPFAAAVSRSINDGGF